MVALRRLLALPLLAALPLCGWPHFDESLFMRINGARHSSLEALSAVSGDLVYVPQIFYIYCVGYGHYAGEPGTRDFGSVGLAASAADIAATQALKGLFRRSRPRLALEGARGNYSHGFFSRVLPTEKYGFPSQSASLTASEAVILGKAFPRYDKYFVLVWVLNGWSKMYEAAHYPLDILAGTAVGAGLTYALLPLLEKADLKIRPAVIRLPLLTFRKNF